MTSLTSIADRPLGFYDETLKAKLSPWIKEGEGMDLEDAITLSRIASTGAWFTSPCAANREYSFMRVALDIGASFSSFDLTDPELITMDDLDHDEWLHLARWSSELVQVRLNDYNRAKVAELHQQSPDYNPF
ncbi:hypothetical protein NG799_27695 [Laspinema sp. D1]|uniref:Uncharacterized protein n=1 Tax=Laspinema palackyanum D2a TaxID=2953684 RepID=A0ABT2N392_9CYAN|nr:hypothetical protein [Laspinema sp. D2a]